MAHAPRRRDLNGQRFGRWWVVSFSHIEEARRSALWLCQCDCGATNAVRAHELLSGKSQSCGCLKAEGFILRATRHGHAGDRGDATTRSPEYNSWNHMLARCRDKNSRFYRHYGGRGIKVCDRWLNSFAAFLADMGPRPKGTSIDRVNNDGNYEPGNCRWATPRQQNSNQQRHRRLRNAV